MFDFLVNGSRVLTVDDVGEAVLDYARVLMDRGRTAIVTFPALIDGERGDAWMTVGHGLPLSAMQSRPILPISLEGTEFAQWDIRRRIAEIEDALDSDSRP